MTLTPTPSLLAFSAVSRPFVDQINLGAALIHLRLEEHEMKNQYEHVHKFQVQEARCSFSSRLMADCPVRCE